MELETYFDDQTMSVHLRQDAIPVAKKGRPGSWKIVPLAIERLTKEDIKRIAQEIHDAITQGEQGFLERERTGSSIIQLGNYRIVITREPFSDGWEITAVRPVAKLNLDDYHLDEKLHQRLTQHAEGVLIAGAPGEGKTTLARALAEYLAQQGKIVKTLESPRDMLLRSEITQYSLTHGERGEIHDVLLLSRPDNTFFDEMRATEDFQLFADLRLAGIGMVGVLHATTCIDAIHRFIGRIEIGVIPQIVDTVTFVKEGKVANVLQLRMMVKVPTGMAEADLARPVVEVRDFLTRKLMYEIYSYGEQTVVIPIEKKERKVVWELAAERVKQYFKRYTDEAEVDFVTDETVAVHVPQQIIPRVIGPKGEEIGRIEKALGLHIDIGDLSQRKKKPAGEIHFEVGFDDKNLILYLEKGMKDAEVAIYEDEDLLAQVRSSQKALVKISRKSAPGKAVERSIKEGRIKIVKI